MMLDDAWCFELALQTNEQKDGMMDGRTNKQLKIEAPQIKGPIEKPTETPQIETPYLKLATP